MSRSNQSGFTLIEILIAVLLLAGLTFAVVEITGNSFLTKERTTRLNADNLQIETAMSRFEWDFSQIYSPLYFSQIMNFNQAAGNNNGQAQGSNNAGDQGGFTDPGAFQGGGQGGFIGGGNGGMTPQNPALAAYVENLTVRMQTNEHFMNVSQEGLPIPRFYSPEKTVFEFFTSSNRRKIENTKQSHFGWVRYALGPEVERPDQNEDSTDKIAEIPKGLKTLVRYFTADDPYSDKRINPDSGLDAEKIKAAVLLEHVESLEFAFWNLQTRKWETSLRSIQNGESVIHGVRIKLAWYDSQGLKRTTDRIFRTHWPISIPVDTQGAGGVIAGSNAGQNAGSNAGNNSGSNSGANDGEDDGGGDT